MGVAATYVSPTIRSSGTTFAQLQAGGLAKILDNLIATNVAIADPTTAPTVNVTGGGASGGFLTAGVYFLSYSWSNGVGETLAKETAASFTVASGNIPQVTIPALPTGVSAARIYLTPVGGASGSEVLYATGVTATTYNLSGVAGVNPLATPSTVNTTSLANLQSYLNAPRANYAQRLYGAFNETLHAFLSGHPIAQADAMTRLHQLAAVFKALAAAADEATSLVYANTGTVTQVSVGPGKIEPRRTFP